MVRIDSSRCTGCGNCAEACRQGAITVEDGLAVLNQELCVECGTCLTVCPDNAIRETVPVHAEASRGGDAMRGRGFGFRGSGPRGGAGFGFRGASPPWPYAGRGRGGLPRCWHPGLWGGARPYAVPWAAPASPAPTGEQELGFLKEQARVLREELERTEARMAGLATDEK